jgi:dTDP-4-amino-4,6-dideoxy-D-galactose acyltransferase
MPTLSSPAAAISITHLDWDTSHFGFSVGRIAAETTDAELHTALNEARTRAYRLVYWATPPDRAPPPRLLAEFNGRLVDRKVTFSRSLSGADQPAAKSHVTIVPFDESECSTELTALAIAAGAYSRFAADPRIPRDKFERLYQVWIERSVRGEIADAVLVARDSAAEAHLAGMITVKVTNGVGNIGLVAVAETHRGRGIGSHLIDAAHGWMIARNATKTTVVTQAANAPACRLYERAGYTIEQAENYYHFWP